MDHSRQSAGSTGILTSENMLQGLSKGRNHTRAPQVAPGVKSPPASAGDVRETSSIPGSERSSGEGHGYPLQCSGLENPRGRGAWWATVHGVAKNWTQLQQLSTHARKKSHTQKRRKASSMDRFAELPQVLSVFECVNV